MIFLRCFFIFVLKSKNGTSGYDREKAVHNAEYRAKNREKRAVKNREKKAVYNAEYYVKREMKTALQSKYYAKNRETELAREQGKDSHSSS